MSRSSVTLVAVLTLGDSEGTKVIFVLALVTSNWLSFLCVVCFIIRQRKCCTHGVLEMLVGMMRKWKALHQQGQLYRAQAPGVPEVNKFHFIKRTIVH